MKLVFLFVLFVEVSGDWLADDEEKKNVNNIEATQEEVEIFRVKIYISAFDSIC